MSRYDSLFSSSVLGEQARSSSIRFSLSSLSPETKQKLKDCILGVIFGNAFGDALGLATEFMSKEQAAQSYPLGVTSFDDIVTDMHRVGWTKGDWTDDTDQMICIMDSFISNSGVAVSKDFAERLHLWIYNGFTEVGDEGGSGIGRTTINVVQDPDFLEMPHQTAVKIWKKYGCDLAANGAVMRTSIVGCVDFQKEKTVAANALEFSRVTHADPRCDASVVTISSIIASLLRTASQEGFVAFSAEDVRNSMEDGFRMGRRTWTIAASEPRPKDVEDYEKHIGFENIEDLKLAERSGIGYTYKCMGSAIWALKQVIKQLESTGTVDAYNILHSITMEAGDADTNGAVAGACIGVVCGYSALPERFIQRMPNQKWLMGRSESFLTLLGLSASPAASSST